MLKKLLIFIMICVSLSIYVYADGDKNIRVGLFYGDSAKESVEIDVDGTVTILTPDDVDSSVEFYVAEYLKIDGNEYRGYVTVVKNSEGLLNVINTVELEDYLYSVVAKEMSASFEKEALKAQAVAARTYVLKKLGRHEGSGFDVCSSVHCQAYSGKAAEEDKVSAAVYETKGQAIYYDNELIDAVYSATSGGFTETSVNVWGTEHPYLQAVSDEYEEEDVYGHTWERELTAEAATDRMKDYDIGYVTDIRIDEVTGNGVVTELTVVGTDGEKTFKKESCRNIFPSTTLSQAYTIEPVSKDTGFAAFSGKIDKTNMYLLSYDNVIKFESKPLYLLTADGVVKREQGENTSYIFKGRGYGHLVGMSQNGANGMAKNGFTYDEILKHYYSGVEIY